MVSFPHHPVLLAEVIQAFESVSIRILVDGTLGAGGHARLCWKGILKLNIMWGSTGSGRLLRLRGSVCSHGKIKQCLSMEISTSLIRLSMSCLCRPQMQS